ncbi:MAG: hypothetical protein LQ337_005434 [Flavoplaca oasis]|nr:MAG: hypothetical protein LQ337_005434 [Flavoplaca oasis]
MSLDYRIFSFLILSFLLPTLINSSPHPQRGNRQDHRPADKVAVVEQTTTTTTSDDTAVIDQDDSKNDDDDTPIVPSSGSGSGSGKRGLAYNSSSPSLQVFANSDISWVHSWSSSPFDAPSEFLFVPTLWGDEPPHTDNWASLAEGHPYLMSFNEPDIIGQANMEVGDAVAAYKRLMFPLRKDGVQIGAPSVCSGSGENEAGIPMGTGWLREFLGQCNDPNSCVADFVSGHWYGCPGGTCSVSDDVSSFKGYVDELISTAGRRDVWVPEFQRYGDEAGQREFLEDVLPWLDSSAVVRYAYYMVVDGILTTGGEVNALGSAYAGI